MIWIKLASPKQTSKYHGLKANRLIEIAGLQLFPFFFGQQLPDPLPLGFGFRLFECSLIVPDVFPSNKPWIKLPSAKQTNK